MKRLNFNILYENHDVTAYERHYTSSLLSTCQHRNSSPAISTSWPQPWSRGQASAFDWQNTPSELCDFHSQSQGKCWYVRTALETLSTQIGGEWSISLPRERIIGPFWSQNLTVDLRLIYLTPRDLTAWSQQYRDDKCTKQLYPVWILPVDYKWIMNRHARRIDPSTHVLTASWRDSACGVGGQCCWTLSWRCEFCSPFIHTHFPVLELLLLYFSKKKKKFSMRSVLTHTGNRNRLYNWWITFISINIIGNQNS